MDGNELIKTQHELIETSAHRCALLRQVEELRKQLRDQAVRYENREGIFARLCEQLAEALRQPPPPAWFDESERIMAKRPWQCHGPKASQ